MARNAKTKVTRKNEKRVTFRLPVRMPRIMRDNDLRTRNNRKCKKKIKKVSLHHMEWDKKEHTFVQRPPHHPPKVNVTATYDG